MTNLGTIRAQENRKGLNGCSAQDWQSSVDGDMAWRMVAIAETIRRAIDRKSKIILMTDPGSSITLITRRVVRMIARETGTEDCWRAPHNSVSDAGLTRELELAADGLLYLTEVDDFRLSTLARVGRRKQAVIATIYPLDAEEARIMPLWAERLAKIAKAMGAYVVDVRDHR